MNTGHLIMAVLGAILPYAFIVGFFAPRGVSLPAFPPSKFANGAAGVMSIDAVGVSIVLWIFMFVQRRRVEASGPHVFMVLNGLIGLACAFPACIDARERLKGSAQQEGSRDGQAPAS